MIQRGTELSIVMRHISQKMSVSSDKASQTSMSWGTRQRHKTVRYAWKNCLINQYIHVANLSVSLNVRPCSTKRDKSTGTTLSFTFFLRLSCTKKKWIVKEGYECNSFPQWYLIYYSKMVRFYFSLWNYSLFDKFLIVWGIKRLVLWLI